MHEPTPRKTRYIPPSNKEIEQYSRTVCKVLGDQRDPYYASGEFLRGFTEFMKLAVNIQAKYLNRRTEHVSQKV